MKCDKKGVGFYLIWYTNVTLSTVFSYYCMHLLASGRYQPLLLGSVGELYPYLSIYLFMHVAIRWILEQIDGKGESLENAEKCVDKVINNCILYMAIFSGLLCSGRYQDIYTEGQVLQLAELFLWGRVIFSVGYLLGTAIGVQSLRSYGFGLNIGSLAALITPFFGTNFLNSFK